MLYPTTGYNICHIHIPKYWSAPNGCKSTSTTPKCALLKWTMTPQQTISSDTSQAQSFSTGAKTSTTRYKETSYPKNSSTSSRPPQQAQRQVRRRQKPQRVQRRSTSAPRIPDRTRTARRAHTRCSQHTLEPSCKRGRHLQTLRGDQETLRSPRRNWRQGHRSLLPHRRKIQLQLVRSQISTRIPESPELRRFMDRMGQPSPQPHRETSTHDRTDRHRIEETSHSRPFFPRRAFSNAPS